MKKYILFFFIGILLILEHLDTQTALQTKIDITVTAEVLGTQQSIQMTDGKGKQLNTITLVQNVSSDNPKDVQSSQFSLTRGNGLPALKIAQGSTMIRFNESSITYSNGAIGRAEIKNAKDLGTNLQSNINTITNTVTASDYSNTGEVSTAYPTLTISWDKFASD